MLSAVERGSTCIRPDLALREREKSAIEKRVFLKANLTDTRRRRQSHTSQRHVHHAKMHVVDIPIGTYTIEENSHQDPPSCRPWSLPAVRYAATLNTYG